MFVFGLLSVVKKGSALSNLVIYLKSLQKCRTSQGEAARTGSRALMPWDRCVRVACPRRLHRTSRGTPMPRVSQSPYNAFHAHELGCRYDMKRVRRPRTKKACGGSCPMQTPAAILGEALIPLPASDFFRSRRACRLRLLVQRGCARCVAALVDQLAQPLSGFREPVVKASCPVSLSTSGGLAGRVPLGARRPHSKPDSGTMPLIASFS